MLHFDRDENPPSLELETSDYGTGDYDLDPHPNVLPVLVDRGEGTLMKDGIAVLETNLDDATPEVLDGLQETLADAGRVLFRFCQRQ